MFSQTDGRRDFRYDLMNVIACFAVIMLHVSAGSWGGPNGSRGWYICILYETVFYWAVPVFFMLSGAKLIDYRKHYDTRTFLQKRLLKVGVPYLFWSLFAIIAGLTFLDTIILADIDGFRKVVELIITPKAVDIYWFFPVIISLYLVIPFLSQISENKRRESFGYLIVLNLITASVIPFVFRVFHMSWNSAWESPFSTTSGAVTYLLFGYYLTHYEVTRKIRKMIYCAGIIGWGVRFLGTIVLSLRDAKLNGLFYGYNMPCGMTLSIAVFVFFFYHDWSGMNRKFIEFFTWCSSHTFGIYLTHFYILRI
jgi:surface polysaccharide O-acyltransferase-like enzyme